MDEAVKEFLVESVEGLDVLDRELLALEKAPDSKQALLLIFRAIHTIKGTSGCLGLAGLESIAHAGENLLSLLRDGTILPTRELVDALLRMSDALRRRLAAVEANQGNEPAVAPETELIALLERLLQTESPATAPAVAPARAAAPLAPVVPVASVAPVAPVAPVAQTPAQAEGEAPKSGAADSTIRVDVALLDRLMNLVGELVLARNQVLQFTAQRAEPALNAASQRLNLITGELQEGVMKTRMQPIGNLWQKFPRIIREVAQACGKEVRLELEGEGTELDKTLLEAIKDPLMHLIRNAIDHGFELPEVRRARGKPAVGTLRLSAAHESGQVNIRIADDGAGIDTGRVRQKAVERGLLTAQKAAALDEHELISLIFLPGFSTAEKVTHVSGRGVGLDVVRTNIERIGGTVDILTHKGEGTTFKIKIPLTLAIIPALIITSGGERYAIPQLALLELVRLEGAAAAKGIEYIHGTPVYRLRGKLLPIVYLNRQLGIEEQPGGTINMVVLQTDDRQFGLVVDEINDTVEIVVKPLSKHLKRVTALAGATILGDGKVALILDVRSIAQAAHVVAEVRDRVGVERREEASAQPDDDTQIFLLCSHGADGRLAVPLSQVARLEEFDTKGIEHIGHQQVVQYRGRILPLVHLAQVFGGAVGPIEPRERLHVVVHTNGTRSAGLVVDGILDIVRTPLNGRRPALRPGVLCAAVIQDRITEVLDVQGVLGAVDPGFFQEEAPRVQ